MDIQSVSNYCKAITYMCSYLSKQENECSQTMKETFKQSPENGAGSYGQMKPVAHTYASKYSVLYKKYQCIKYARHFPNKDVPETRVRIILSKKDILELPKDSGHIYKKNMFNRYLIC